MITIKSIKESLTEFNSITFTTEIQIIPYQTLNEPM